MAGLPAVTPRLAPLVHRAAGERIVDLLWHLPFGIVDRRMIGSIPAARTGATATLLVRVEEHRPSERRGRPYRIRVSDAAGALDLVFFNMPASYLRKILPPGESRIVSGRVDSYDGFLQMAHPDLILPPEQASRVGGIHPVYRSTAGLPPEALAEAVREALAITPELPVWMDAALARREAWPDWLTALRQVHTPGADADLAAVAPARRRLAYDEILASQLALAVVREGQRRERGRANAGDGSLQRPALAHLGFTLTASQAHAAAEIAADMGSERRMLRLLQGDVGSGKTVVALLAMLAAVEAGGQAALMAPTEILARQHWRVMEPVCHSIGIEAALLLGQGRGEKRAPTLAGLEDGRIKLVIGTHALAQASVTFADLRLVVVDEQHRFGVDDRAELAAKGRTVDTLLMTATPIPRTLSLSMYGDMEVSRLTEKPPGRQPIDTRAISLDRMDEVLAAIGRKIAAGARIYWVCPLVEETELSDLAAARQRAITLAAVFGEDRVGLVHGKLPSAEKNAAMAAFAEGRTSILVATTVIEVGVDVPAATVMVIEHAERYGIAQLHQLRGRVGRGSERSTCLLLFAPGLGKGARERAEHPARNRGRILHRRGGSAASRRGRRVGYEAKRAAGFPGRGYFSPSRPDRDRDGRCAPDHGTRSRPCRRTRSCLAGPAVSVRARSRHPLPALRLILLAADGTARGAGLGGRPAHLGRRHPAEGNPRLVGRGHEIPVRALALVLQGAGSRGWADGRAIGRI